jgi:hypothetical protein
VGPLMGVGGVTALWPGNCISMCFYSRIKIFCCNFIGARKLGSEASFAIDDEYKEFRVLAGCFFGQLSTENHSLITRNQLHKWWEHICIIWTYYWCPKLNWK